MINQANKSERYMRFRYKRGNALILVLILFLVISLLVIGMLGVAATEHKMIIAEERIDQAYYTARAAVQGTVDWINANYNARDKMATVIPSAPGSSKTSSGELNGVDYDLSVWRETSELIIIKAVATNNVNGEVYHASASLSLTETVSAYHLFEDAIYSWQDFGMSAGGGSGSNVVIGSVSTGASTAPENLNVYASESDYASGTQQAVVLNKEYIFTGILPEDMSIFNPAEYFGTLSLTDGSIVNETSNLNAWYEDLSITGTVTIKNVDVAGNPQDVHILTNDLNIASAAIIKPSDNNGGRIFIYVAGEIFCGDKFGIDGNPDQPIVYLICSPNGGNISFSGNPFMRCYLYGPYVNVEYGGTTIFYGAIIANVYGWNGNVTVKYRAPELENSPFSSLELSQSRVSISNLTWNKD